MLVIEDDGDTRELLTQLLESAGLEVETADNGVEGLHKVETTTPDVVLLDLMMPVMDGVNFLTQLRENPYHRGLPVIVLTAKELSRQEREFLEDKSSLIIPKGDSVERHLHDALSSILPIDPEVDE